MPYIKQIQRDWFYPELGALAQKVSSPLFVNVVHPVSAGGLNYVISTLLLSWLGGSPTYSDYNAAIGVLECAKMELYRRQVAGYEDRKIEENGDI